MENIGKREQLLWGMSVDMASDEEIDECYKNMKEYLAVKKDDLQICEFSKGTIRPKANRMSGLGTPNDGALLWSCGEQYYSSSDLCDKQPSISKQDLRTIIEKMVPDDINVEGYKIIDKFTDKKFIYVCPCQRIFLKK